MISIVVITCNRPHLLKPCVEKVLGRVSGMTKQIIVWDNSDDAGTKQILAALPKERFLVTGCGENIGLNAYARAFRLANQPFLIELDDDVIDAPQDWDARLLAGFQNLDRAGYLAADMVNDPKSDCAHCRWHEQLHEYTAEKINGHTYLWGPTGGWCSMTTRAIYDRVGGFPEDRRLKFFHEDGQYIQRVTAAGYRFGLYGDLLVHHASGRNYTADAVVEREKQKFLTAHLRRIDRRRRIRDTLIAIPVVGRRFFARKVPAK